MKTCCLNGTSVPKGYVALGNEGCVAKEDHFATVYAANGKAKPILLFENEAFEPTGVRA